jgi:predicted  nucleic acid-binding Zn-ribbon protein
MKVEIQNLKREVKRLKQENKTLSDAQEDQSANFKKAKQSVSFLVNKIFAMKG